MPYKDPDRARVYMREYRRRFPEKARESVRRSLAKHGPEIHNERWRYYRIRHKYRMGKAEFALMLAAQGGGCKICAAKSAGGKKERHLYVEHDHKTGRVRGLVCHRCNALVAALENPLRPVVEAYLAENT